MSNLSALLGQMLFAWQPDDHKPHHPGAKFRPVLVIDIDPEHRRLLLAYGTTQRVDTNGVGEITFRSGEIPGLTKDTKFCLGYSKWVPLRPEYFSKTHSGSDFSHIGSVPKVRLHEFKQRLEELDDIDRR